MEGLIKKIKEAAGILKNGGTIIYPTDTAYGLGADATNETAVKKIFEIKGRDFNKPIHVVVKDFKMASELVYFNDLAKIIFEKFLPGPLTIVLPKKASVSSLLTGGLKTLGIRLPKNEITQELSQLSNIPYTTTSANISGKPNPYTITDTEISNLVDEIIDVGRLPEVAPSTIVEICDDDLVLHRAGPIPFDLIQREALVAGK